MACSNKRWMIGVMTVAAALGPIVSASADPSNISYSYDAKGRLTSVCDARPDQGELTKNQFDAADNRSRYTHARTDINLPTGNSLLSPDGRFIFIMQADGNLVLYKDSPSGWIPMNWATNTVGSGATIASFQSDGNLVLYSPSGPVWHSNTWQYHCAALSVQNDGNVVIKDTQGSIVWSTGTGGN